VFNSVTTFDKWFNAPFESYKLVSRDDMALKEEEQLYLISRLHSALEPFMLRCVCALICFARQVALTGHTRCRRLKKDVAAELPDKVEKVIKCRMSALQELMYRECTANKAYDVAHAYGV
jgi:ATP-dependent helicase STH1/SNF2